MKEKLIIKNFGPIKEVELELGRFTVLIGEQATGKSTVAKLLAVCRDFSYIVHEGIPLKFDNGNFFWGLQVWGLNEALNDNSYIFYQNQHYSFKVEKDHHSHQWQDASGEAHEEVEPYFFTQLHPLSLEFENLLVELNKIRPAFNGNILSTRNLSWTIPTSFFQNDVAAVIDKPFYLPAERGLQSIFSLGKNSIQNLSDALFNQLAELDGIARKFTSETAIEPVDIVYKNVNGKGFIRKQDQETFYSLFNAATGYQSIIPIVLSIKYYNLSRRKRQTLIVEEPELNLFPDAQNRLTEFMVDAIMNNGNSILLTTHSPYILTSLNNCIYAAQVGKNKPEEVSEIISKKYWLDIEEVSAYRLMKDGTAKNIVANELKQLEVERIDEVSDELSREWHRLADLKFGNPHEVS